ncbi:hypothetical protein [Streptomyces cinereoruber]|uniref:hypothetical protein n=1 Tax=Streptomyces cinereoruber TaxID=67260 RepID=UPI0036464236
MATLALRVVEDGEGHMPAYFVPKTPDAAWSAADSERRIRVARAALGAVLAVQTLLALRRPAAVSPAEAISLTAGHALLSDGTRPWGVPDLAGASWGFPLVAALTDTLGGVETTRAACLAITLLTTVLLHGLTTRLFNVRAGLCAAALFAVLPSTAVLGGSATPEAAGLCLLAVATRLLAGADRAVRRAALCAVAAACAAVVAQYWTVLCLPGMLALAAAREADGGADDRVMRRSQTDSRGGVRSGRAAVVAAVTPVMTMAVAAVVRATGLSGGPLFPSAAGDADSFPHGVGPATGLLIAVSVIGAGCLLFRERMGEHPSTASLQARVGRGRRTLWIFALFCAAIVPLAVAQVCATVESGLGPSAALTWFAAPLAGVGTSRLMGRHFRFPQAGIALWTALLCLGMPQADRWFAGNTDPDRLVRLVSPYAGASGSYLGVPAEVPAYQLRRTVSPGRWTDCTEQTDGGRSAGVSVAACARAVRVGEFRVIVLDGVTRLAVQSAVRDALRGNPHYRLLAELAPYGALPRAGYRIWVKVACEVSPDAGQLEAYSRRVSARCA